MTRIKQEDLELTGVDGGGAPMYNYNGKPFTGILLGYEKDGTLAFEEEFENGYQEGWTRYYHPNGKLEQEYKSHNNVTVDGTFKKWDIDGNLIKSF